MFGIQFGSKEKEFLAEVGSWITLVGMAKRACS
jgi:hypothetical protein